MSMFKQPVTFLSLGRGRASFSPAVHCKIAAVLAIATIMLVGCSNTSSDAGNNPATADQTELTILAAASLTESFDSIIADYEESTGVKISASYGASSALALQVQSRAPADLVATADRASMTTALQGRTGSSKPQVFAHNDLVIAVQPGNPRNITSLSELADPELLVSLCAPAVPCGKLADAALKASATTLPQASRAPDVKAAFAPLIAGEADAALVYRTDVMASTNGIELIELPNEAQSTEYPIAALDGPNQDQAQDFIDFLLSPDSQSKLADFGFTAP